MAAVTATVTDTILGTLSNGKILGLSTFLITSAGLDATAITFAAPVETVEYAWIGHRNPVEYATEFVRTNKSLNINPVGSINTGTIEVLWVGV